MKIKNQTLLGYAISLLICLTTFASANVMAQDKTVAVAPKTEATATAPKTEDASTSQSTEAKPTSSNPDATSATDSEPVEKVVININKRRLPRLCVPSPLLKMVETSHSVNTSDAIRTVMVEYMSGPMIEVVPLDSRIPVHIEAESKMKDCDLVLYSTVTLTKSGNANRLGSLLKKIAPAAALISLTGSRTATMAGTAVRVAAEVLGEVTADRKKKDKIKFEYRLMKVGVAEPVVANVEVDKSKEESEDVLTPMLAKNAEVVVIAALRHYSEELGHQKPAEQAAPAQEKVHPTQDGRTQVASHRASTQAPLEVAGIGQ
jgi:hypothetical protein